MIEGGCETNRVTRISWRLDRCSCHIVVTCCNLELVFRMVTNSIQPPNLMYTPRQWLLLPYINMDPSTQEGHRRLPHIHASKAPLIFHRSIIGRSLVKLARVPLARSSLDRAATFHSASWDRSIGSRAVKRRATHSE